MAGGGVEEEGGVEEDGSPRPHEDDPPRDSSSGVSGVDAGVEEVGFDDAGVVGAVGVLGAWGALGVCGAVPEPTLGGGVLTGTLVGLGAGASTGWEGGAAAGTGLDTGVGGGEDGSRGAETTTPWPGAAAPPRTRRGWRAPSPERTAAGGSPAAAEARAR